MKEDIMLIERNSQGLSSETYSSFAQLYKLLTKKVIIELRKENKEQRRSCCSNNSRPNK